MLKNKKGDIPVTILVIAIVFLCGLALLSFYVSGSRASTGFEDVSIVEKAAVEIEKISVYSGLGFSDEEIEKAIGAKTDEPIKYLLFERGSVSVKYYLP